jgi:hypothetical protein
MIIKERFLLWTEGLTFKQKQLLKKKAEAASSHNWNTLFLGQNAVADLIAETYNTTKDKVDSVVWVVKFEQF